MPLAAGARLASYEILAPLGSGGMGEVYRARDTKLHRDVALKVLSSRIETDPTALARFEREARAVAALNHPNVVTIYAVEEVEGRAFLAMELVEGATLDALIPTRGLPVEGVLEHAIPLADALAAAHGPMPTDVVLISGINKRAADGATVDQTRPRGRRSFAAPLCSRSTCSSPKSPCRPPSSQTWMCGFVNPGGAASAGRRTARSPDPW
jgi:hypothetical protein